MIGDSRKVLGLLMKEDEMDGSYGMCVCVCVCVCLCVAEE